MRTTSSQVCCLIVVLIAATTAWPQDTPEPEAAAPGTAAPTTAADTDADTDDDAAFEARVQEELARLDPMTRLQREVALLREEMLVLRMALADAHLESASAERELQELRRFISDHHEYGRDFEAYRAVKAITEQEEVDRRREERRAEYETRRAERDRRRQTARAARAEREAADARINQYADMGFSPLGLDVFIGRNAYSYPSFDSARTRFDYVPGIGRYLRFYPIGTQLDFSSMTISGSVLNGAETVRNVGVAIAFFDAFGNQVGHEIIRVDNARPNVPYPYTSTIEMALDRPFNSSSIYVLYADETG